MRGKQIRMQHVREVLRLKAAGSSNRQISTLRRSRSFVDWNKIGSLAKTIDGLRASIAGPLAAAAPPQQRRSAVPTFLRWASQPSIALMTRPGA
jgi:hypothetical protein